MTYSTQTLAEVLRDQREEMGLSMRELSKQKDISVPYISDLESGSRIPIYVAAVVRVAGVYELDPVAVLRLAYQTRYEKEKRRLLASG